ncbi:thioesterase II family protein [Streptomyces sp. NPDC001985]|uniref:thioesterase II family protein n=1 Tax=Streptomyces sp. NPDC001985 TaxID=3154406 RepID=UPI00331F3DE5
MLSVDSPLIRRFPRTRPSWRLVCLPYAGAGASVFTAWPALLPDTVEVVAVQLPGREDRVFDPPLTRLDLLVRTLAIALKPYLTTPVALYGHCAGALLAFEVAGELRTRHGLRIPHLILGSQAAPHLAERHATALHTLPDAEFRSRLGPQGGVAPDVLADDRMMELLLPGVRADFQLWERYAYRPRPPLDCAVTVIGGDRDEQLGTGDLTAWEDHTTGPFTHHPISGGHFFLDEAPAELSRLITSALGVPELEV